MGTATVNKTVNKIVLTDVGEKALAAIATKEGLNINKGTLTIKEIDYRSLTRQSRGEIDVLELLSAVTEEQISSSVSKKDYALFSLDIDKSSVLLPLQLRTHLQDRVVTEEWQMLGRRHFHAILMVTENDFEGSRKRLALVKSLIGVYRQVVPRGVYSTNADHSNLRAQYGLDPITI